MAAWAFVVILELLGAEYSFHWFAAGSLAVGNCDMRPSLLGSEPSKLDVVLRNLLVLRGRVSGASPGRVLSWARMGHERPAVNEDAVHRARAVKCILGTLSAVTIEWIAGHMGHPWNELADVAAKQTARDPATTTTSRVGSVDPLLIRRQLDWFFLSRLASTERVQYPPLLDGAFAITNHGEVLSNRDVASMLGSSPNNVRRGGAPCASAISLRVASANVNTLSPCDDTTEGPPCLSRVGS